MNRDYVYALINAERDHQDAVYPDDNASSSDVDALIKLAILTEEVGEVARSLIESDKDNLLAELVQVAAVAVAWLEAM